jgi:hypothetical protein
LPCPACGGESVIIRSSFPSNKKRVHCRCGMGGPLLQTEESAISAWNSLPRALTWTNEPPKVAGWYHWRSGKGQNMTMIQTHIFNGVCGFWDGNGVFKTDLNRGEWAGPIPSPID